MSSLIHRSRARMVVTAAFAFGLAVSAAAPVALAKPDKPVNPQACAQRDNNSYQKLLDCVTLDGVRAHQAAFQSFADANGGTRPAGSPGHDASADYVAGLLSNAGYEVTRQSFDFPFFEETAPGALEIVGSPAIEFDVMTYSGSGDVTGSPIGVDLSLADGSLSTSGCEATDFDAINLDGSTDVVVLQRGACSFAAKATNAQNAGAEAVVVFNQGTAGREGLFFGTLGEQSAGVITIPVVSAAFTDAAALLSATDLRVAAFTISEVRTTDNVIAQSTTGDPDNVVMAGAHLDSVAAGPGIQDNGSGSAAILEVALKLAGHEPVNQLRFAWWSAEEFGLLGSEYYVQNLTDEELDDIALYLNFDMIGSPNSVFFVYDANESSFDAPVVVPEGSEDIEGVFETFYSWKDQPYDDSAFSGRSDYQEFINNGIPAGGLFTGAEGIKTEQQAGIWGGTAGDQYDPCYHLACDTYDNIDLHTLDVNSDAVAFSVLTYAYSTEGVNGVVGEPVPGKKINFPAPDGPRLTNDMNGGGGLDHDHEADAS